ncbi:MAG: ABC transporter related protein, partial [uncultured bacterium (gcode 4)]
MRNPYINLVINSYKFAKEKKKVFIIWMILFVVANWFNLLQPFIFGQILNSVQKWWPDMFKNFTTFLLLYSLMPFFSWIFHWNWRIIERTVAFHISKNYKEYLFGIVTKLPFRWHSDNHSWETINKISKATNALERFSDDHFVYIQTIITFLWSLIWIAVISVYFSFYLALGTIFVISIILYFDKKLIKLYDEVFKKEHKVASLLHDYISNIRTLITLHFESLAENELAKRIFDIFPIKKKRFIINEIKWFSISMFITAIQFLILFLYWYTTFNDSWTIMVWNLVILFQYLQKFTWTFFDFAWKYEWIVKLNSELKTSECIIDDYNNLVINENEKINSWNNIKIKNLNFKYDENQEDFTLKNINIELNKGQKIAFVWESWSGKSTMLSIIKWLYETSDSEINIDSEIFNNSNILTNITTLIPQDPEIFENTLWYNVTFWIDADEKKINESMQIAKFDTVLKRLKNWSETNIKE